MSHREYATVVLCFLTVFILSIGSLPAAAQTSGLVAAYGFNETSGSTAADSSGNNNTGTLGSGVTRTTAGRFGSALVFNGSSFVTIPDAASLDLTTGMTLEAWVFPTTKAGNLNTAIMKEQPGQLVYALYTAGNPANRPNVYFNVSADSSGERGIAGPSALQLNTWSHLAATYNGSTLSLYVNGALVASQAFSGSIITSTGPLRIGGNGVSGQYFTGRIDEVRIYNRPLSQTEIQSDMNTAVGGTTPPDNTGPSVAITSHTNNQTVTTSSITVSGTASDSGLGNNGISSVTVNGVAASGGTATGSATANWSQSVTLNPGANTITVVAKDASTAQNSTTTQITVNFSAPDTTGPAVAITSHTNNQTVTTSSITVSGTASDSGLGNNGISSVTVNGVAASGGTATGSGTANWSQSVTLNPGANTITVVAKDASTAQNSTTTQITVNFSAPDTTGPAVAITSHTNNQTVTTSSITVSGTASDSGLGNNGISSVTVNGVAASGGTATGSATANWSQSVTLNPGANTITVVAKDASTAQNSTTVSITVNFSAPDTTGPAVAITSHTNNQTVTTSSITVSGTASDSGLGNNGISSVTVNGVAASGGTATGSATANWSQSVTLNPGANTITVVAKDASTAQNSTTVSITVNFSAPDTTGPAVAITSHTNNQTVTTSSITVSGTASDSGLGNNGISSVTVNGVAASGGTATGSATANWSQSVTLNPGANTITVVAKDASTAQNSTTVSITVNFSAPDTTGPAVAITSHTNNQTVTTSSITVSGTASDSGLGNNGISSVTVNGVAASGGTATGSGTANWSQSVTLNPGANTITVVAKDASTAQNSTTTQITVNYNAADTTGPAVAITSHTNNQAVTTSSITVSGTASDSGLGNNGISSVTVNGVAASGGTATGSATANWSQSVTLNPGANTITVVAKDASTAQNSTTTQITVNFSAPDTTGPAVAITSHTNNQTVTTSPITVSGTASDSGLGNNGISSVTVNGVAASGGTATGSGTANWSQSVTLNPGANTITVVAKDNSTNQNSTTVSITVNYNAADSTGPAVAITSHTNNQAVTTSPITVSGTATDSGLGNNGISSVTVNGVAASGGTATGSGTANWSQSVTLNPGANTITVVAKDASTAQNSTTVSITVNYNAPDSTGPAVAITSHTNNQTVTTSPITVSGTASDSGLGNNGISSVTVNGVAASGGTATGSGTANWSQSVTLNPGANTITVVAKDNSTNQNSTTVSITVTYDSTAPTVSITTPTTGTTFSTNTSPLTLGGTASDDVGVTQVSWSNSQGGSGTATGTTNWTASVVLQSGTNVLTVTARDAANNTGTATLTVTYTASSGLVAAYGFNEGSGTSSADASGNGHPANLIGGPTWVAGQSGSALSFNGSSSYATTNLTTTLPNWTVSGWVRSPAAPDGNATSGPIHREANYQINWNQTNPAFRGAVGVRVGGSWYAASFGTLVANTWYYLAATYDGETLNAYTNGVLITSNPAPSGPADSDPNPLTIGKHAAANQFFQGIVDNVRIYSRALSQAEIQADMNTPVGGTPPPDTTGPAVAITSHTNNQTVTTSPITVSGTASDSGLGNNGISSVTVNGVAASGGTATGSATANWSQSVILSPGANTITVVAKDNSTNQNSTTVSITVNYNAGSSDTTGPAVAITSHTNNQTVSTSPITVAGTASDSGLGNNGISSVTVNGVAATGGTAAGSATANWSRSVTLNPGANTITVVAKDASANQNSTTVSITVNYNAPDNTGPAVAITSHTNNQSVNASPVTVSGTASDSGLGNNGISSVTVNGIAASGGTAVGSGTANWSQSIALNPGANTITVVAKDSSTNQNSTTVQITLAYDPTPPTVAITTPTSGATYTASTSPLTLGGTASDNIGVTQVSWSNSLGGSGTATGTTSWTASGITLQSGTNVITVTVLDAANNAGTAILTVTYTPPSGLMAAYSFSEGNGTTSADASGNGHPTNLIGGTTWVAGHTGNAVSFNGVSAYGTVSAFPNLSNWTVSGWVRSPAAPGVNGGSGPIHREANYQIDWDHNNPAFRGSAAVRVGGGWYSASFGALAANTWYYLAATYDGETLNAYTNGVLITSNTAPSGPADSDPNPLTIGKHAAANQFFQGIVDDVRIYSRALSQAEIQADMNTPVGGTPPPSDNIPPTVAITSPASGATVSGSVTVTAMASDNIGVVGVQFLLDGATLGAETSTPPYTTSWNTTGATNGFHAVSAIARDAAGNQTTSLINVTVSNSNPTDPVVVGQWSAPFALPVKAIHMILFRTGEVLMWDGFGLGQEAYVWNSSTGTLTYVPSVDNIFCSAPALMADGSALIAGGHSGGGVGIPDVNRFNPVTKTWSPLAPMAFPRWYPTATTLSDGRVLVVGGSTTCFTCIGDIPELYTPTTNTWTQLGAARLSMPLYPQMFVLSDGRILYASSTEGVIQTQALNVGTQAWTMIDPNAVAGGSSAMYRPGVILKSGSPGAPGRIPTAPSLATAYVLDMNQPSPVWQPVGSMAYPRTYHTLTLLPDGNVLATGGSQTNDPASQPVYAAEIWDAQTETWSTMSSGQMARTYHETALLLPDGRILVAGSGGCCFAPDQLNAEIFSPPYLFQGPRPTISSAPTTIGYGTQFVMGTPDPTSIGSVTLMRLSAVTHQFDRSQNYVPLSFTPVANGLSVQMPANKNLAPPGDYMLFIVNTSGVPSVAAMVKVQ